MQKTVVLAFFICIGGLFCTNAIINRKVKEMDNLKAFQIYNKNKIKIDKIFHCKFGENEMPHVFYWKQRPGSLWVYPASSLLKENCPISIEFKIENDSVSNPWYNCGPRCICRPDPLEECEKQSNQ